MTVKQFLEHNDAFSCVNEGDFSREITNIYCCDLLSVVMGRAKADCAWVTIMGNINAVAVAVLADMSVIVLAEGMQFDEVALNKAKAQNVNIISTDLPIYEAAKIIGGELDA